MANSELLRYVQDQLKAGVAKDAVRKTLVDVGWSSVDIDDAFKAGEQGVSPVAVSSAALPVASSPASLRGDISAKSPQSEKSSPVNYPTSPSLLGGVAKEKVAFGPSPQIGFSPSASSSQKTFEQTGQTIRQDSWQASSSQAGSPVQPSQSKEKTPFGSGDMPRMVSMNQANTMPTVSPRGELVEPTLGGVGKERGRREKMWLTLSIVAGAVAIILAGWLVYDYIALGKKVGGFEEQNAMLSGQIVSLKADLDDALLQKKESESSRALLTNQNTELLNELSFFVKIPSLLLAEGGPIERAITIRGKLEAGVAGSYFFRTAHDVRVTIANAKDEKAKITLPPIVGKEADFTGTYVVGAREVTVTAVNGVPLGESISESGISPVQ